MAPIDAAAPAAPATSSLSTGAVGCNDDGHVRRRILVTGGAGFIGSHIVARLLERHPDCVVFNFDMLDYCASLRNLESVEANPNYHFIRGDITSYDFVNYVLQEQKIDTIIHAAAKSHVDNSFGDSFSFTQNNVVGTHVLLQAARVNKIKRFIHVSTDEVYGEVEKGNPTSTEETLLAPTNPYAATKAAAECLAGAYYKSFDLPVIITRSNNVYGPHQFPEKIIPKFICSILSGRNTVHGEGRNSRRYIYVTDVADAIIFLMEKGDPGQIYNIGTDFEISNIALTRYLLTKLGRIDRLPAEFEHVEHVADRPFNDMRYDIDTSKMRLAFGWEPRIGFEEGMEKQVE
ncbi:dTDP-D-glucose 4,6-dehydratase-like protein [Zopfochytrium polystomum]|nr:dTDP-D-glucose 4,6-dehydratase-like protein [Zopfochytrium polystomum]